VLSLYLLNELSNIDIDGNDGEHDELGGSLNSLWEDIYELADDEQRSAMFESMLAYYESATDGQWYFADPTCLSNVMKSWGNMAECVRKPMTMSCVISREAWKDSPGLKRCILRRNGKK
jgi:hypothetical protein